MTTLQSIVFDRKKYTLKQSQDWITTHGHKLSFYGKGVDIKPTQYRYRQSAPKFNKYVSKKIDDGILFILGIK